MRNETSHSLNSEQDLASIPTAQGGLSRLAIARLKRADVPVAPVLRRAGLTPESIADPEERLSVRSSLAALLPGLARGVVLTVSKHQRDINEQIFGAE
jgi:hypothetical protein